MKIVIAPDSFKGSLSALEVAIAIEKGIRNVDPDIEIIKIPMADGGEGTVQSLIDATGGTIIKLKVHDPLYRVIDSYYGVLGDGHTAVIEMAAASGLTLLKDYEMDPLITTTYGTGELIKDALDNGCNNFIIGLGGSATNDGGCGMAQALGARFLDMNENEIGLGGGKLSRLKYIDVSCMDRRIKAVSFIAASDVDNPLCGEKGASFVYGRQKGATSEDQITLDNGLAHFAQIVSQQLNINIKDFPGAGAAGGLGAGVMIFLNARLESGFDIITNATRLTEKMNGAHLVITGEGRIDLQTAFGKTPLGVAQIAKQKNIPVIAFAGSLDEDYKNLYSKGFDGFFSIVDKPMTLKEAMDNASELLENTAGNVFRLWNTGIR